MTDAKRRIARQELTDRVKIVNEQIRVHLSQAQRADTASEAYTHYGDIILLANIAQSIAIQIKEIDTAPVQEKML